MSLEARTNSEHWHWAATQNGDRAAPALKVETNSLSQDQDVVR